MAYVSKEQKAVFAKLMKEAFPGTAKQRGFKYSLSINNHSSIVCTISEGVIDFIGEMRPRRDTHGNDLPSPSYTDVNHYNIDNNFSGKSREILNKINEILHTDHFDKSDIMTDYFHCAWYVDINIGRWNKPYRLIK